MNKIEAILFDLDGTLLPMEFDAFVKAYFHQLAAYLTPHGYDSQLLLKAIWTGIAAMTHNDGSRRNDAAFWEAFTPFFGEKAEQNKPLFDRYYAEEFDKVSASCGYNPAAAQAVHQLQAAGYTIALATNPVFPAIATRKRIGWAGLEPSDFALYTTYENSRFCKPDTRYYRDVAAQLGIAPEACLMVGNDVTEDMAAAEIGMAVFLLTDHLINQEQKDISTYPNGSFPELLAFIQSQK